MRQFCCRAVAERAKGLGPFQLGGQSHLLLIADEFVACMTPARCLFNSTLNGSSAEVRGGTDLDQSRLRFLGQNSHDGIH